MKTTKLKKHIIAFLLCLAVLLSSMPASAIATDLATDEAASLVGAEVVSLREENVKHFDMGDGTFQAIAYSHPVHEMDSEGNWQDIDFSMNLTQTKGVRAYTNAAGTALAANYIANQPLVTLSGEGTSIAMTLVANANTATMSTQAMTSTATVAAELTATQTQIQTFEDAQAASFSNTLLYENVMPGIDLEYIVDPWTVKENIIVNQPATKYEYRFKLDINGLYPVLQEDGSILIYNSATEAVEYEIPAPYMYDATGEMSFDVSYAITGSSGIYYLTVTADGDWINAGEREFPVVIDPTFLIGTQSVIKDTYIIGEYPNETRGSHRFFYVGEDEVAYVYTPTPSLPTGGSITGASLKLYYYYFDHITSGYVDFTAHRVTDFFWEEGTLTWDSVVNNENYENFGLCCNAEGSAIRAYADIGATSTSPALANVPVTDAVRLWVEGTTTNKGIGLKMVFPSANRSVRFNSTEGSVDYRPQLAYTYVINEVNLILQYDNDYNQRYGTTGENIIDEEITQNRIAGEAAELADFFLEEYNIIVNYGTPTLFESLSDTCPTKEPGGTCSCDKITCSNELVARNHHTNIYANLYCLTSPDQNSVRMAYIGSETCTAYEFQCTSGPLGLALMSQRAMVINNLTTETSETITAIHEMGHMFGIVDHYGDNCFSTDQMNEKESGYSRECLYGEDRGDYTTVATIKICKGCRNRVKQYRDLYSD